MKVYVYYDSDHGDLEVFDSLEKAKAYADKMWPDQKDEKWGRGKDLYREPYQEIHIREIK